MKKIYALLVFAVSSVSAFAQCTPNPNMTGYIEPEKLEDALIDKPYSQTIYFRVPKDTMLYYNGNLIPFSVNKAELASMEGIPAGFSYACNVSNCTFNGGTFGCAVITGTASPVQIGAYGIKIMIKTYATALGIYNVNRYDSGVYDFHIRQYPLSSGEILDSKNPFHIFPNPAASKFTMQTIALNKPAEVKMFNTAGAMVLSQPIAAGNKNTETEINTEALADGLYLVRMEYEGNVVTRKVAIRH